jgi:hypothetical protein
MNGAQGETSAYLIRGDETGSFSAVDVSDTGVIAS